MSYEEFREYEDAADKLCGACVECYDQEGEADGDICDSCPVRKTLDRLREIEEEA